MTCKILENRKHHITVISLMEYITRALEAFFNKKMFDISHPFADNAVNEIKLQIVEINSIPST